MQRLQKVLTFWALHFPSLFILAVCALELRFR